MYLWENFIVTITFLKIELIIIDILLAYIIKTILLIHLILYLSLGMFFCCRYVVDFQVGEFR